MKNKLHLSEDKTLKTFKDNKTESYLDIQEKIFMERVLQILW